MPQNNRIPSHNYRIEFSLRRTEPLTECIKFVAPDAASALARVQGSIPENITVSMFEDDHSMGTVRLVSKGFWEVSES